MAPRAFLEEYIKNIVTRVQACKAEIELNLGESDVQFGGRAHRTLGPMDNILIYHKDDFTLWKLLSQKRQTLHPQILIGPSTW
jgi:hypothetical protein